MEAASPLVTHRPPSEPSDEQPPSESEERTSWYARLAEHLDETIRVPLGDQGDDAIRRARMLLIFSFLFVPACAVAVVIFALRGALASAVIFATGALIAAGSPLWLRRSRSISLVGNTLLALVVIAVSVFAWFAGGLGAPLLYVLVAIPVLATAEVDARAGLLWAGIVLAIFVGFTIFHALDLSPASEVNADSLTHAHAAVGITITLVIVVVVQVYDRMTRNALRRARRADEHRRRLLRRTIASQEDERRRLARDLHDSVGSLLTSIAVSLRALEETEASPKRRTELETLRGHTKMMLDETRRLIHGLHPIVLEAHGLEEAVRQYATEWATSNNITTDIHMNRVDRPHRLSPSIETALYRIVQEALANVAKHAQASTVSILLRREGGRVRLIIEDDGRGFSAETTPPGQSFGIRTISERAAQHGGKLALESAPGTGTSVYVEIPEEER